MPQEGIFSIAPTFWGQGDVDPAGNAHAPVLLDRTGVEDQDLLSAIEARAQLQ